MKLTLSDILSNIDIKPKEVILQESNLEITKEGFDHFMIKEIVEQKDTIRQAVSYTKEELEPLIKAIRNSNKVFLIGAGTASFAAGEIAFFLRKYANINAIELKSYEIESFVDLFTSNDLIFAISQSGETADTIEAVEIAKSKGCKVASLVNMLGSSLTRISDYKYYSRSGPEICVASTKAFTSQLAFGYLLTMSIVNKYKKAKEDIFHLSDKLQGYFNKKLFKKIHELAKKISKHEHFFVLGRGQNYYIALEGALKVKEITYKHFEGFAAGELKHGVIALIDKNTPVFVITSDDENYKDMLSSAAEVKARGAYIIGVGEKSNDLFNEYLKTIESNIDPISNIIPFQILSYYLGIYLGNSPDKPRNLAKSVTVK